MEALNALDNLGSKATPVFAGVRELPTTFPGMPERTKDGVLRLVNHILAQP